MINELIIFSMRIKSYLFRHLNKLKFILLGVKLGKKPLIYNKVYLKVGRNSSIIISRKTKCSTFAKHFVPKSHLLTQFKM